MRNLINVSLSVALQLTILWLSAPSLIAVERVSHPELGFRLAIPNGFGEDLERVKEDVIYAFQRPPSADEKMGTFILITRLRGVLDREKINPKELTARNPQITIMTEKWKDFDIEVFRVPEQMGDLHLLTFNAQVPLKPEAVQVAVIGEAARENELTGVLRSVLGSLEGSTNWLNTNQRISKFAEGITRLVITIGVLAVLTVAVWRAIRKRKVLRKPVEPSDTADRPLE